MNNINQSIQSSCLSTLQIVQKIKKENKQVEIGISNWKLSLAIQSGKSNEFRLIRNLTSFDFSFLTNLVNGIINNSSINIKDRIELASNFESLNALKAKENQREGRYYTIMKEALKKEREELETSLISQYCYELSKSKPSEFVWIGDCQNYPKLSSADNRYHGKIVLYALKGETCCQGIYRDPLSGEKQTFELSYPKFEEDLNKHREKLTEALAIVKKEEKRLNIVIGEVLANKIQPEQLIIQKESPNGVIYQIRCVDQNGRLQAIDPEDRIKRMGTSNIYGLTNLKRVVLPLQVDKLKEKHPNLINLVKDPSTKLPPGVFGIQLVKGKCLLVQYSSSLNSTLSVEMTTVSDEGLQEAEMHLNQLLSTGLSNRVSSSFIEKFDSSSQIEIPPMPEDKQASDLQFLLKIFDQINFSKPGKTYYRNPYFLKNDDNPTTPEELREGLANLIECINKKSDHLGIPSKEHKKAKFYDAFERIMRHNVLQLKEQLNKASKKEKKKILYEIQGHILVLAEGSLHCGSRWQSEAIELYKNLMGRNDQGTSSDLKVFVHKLIDQHKLEVVKSMVQEGLTHSRRAIGSNLKYDISHGNLFILRSLIKGGYEIPLAEAADYDDPDELLGRQGAYINEREVQEAFEQKCAAIPISNLIWDDFNEKFHDLASNTTGLEWRVRIENELRNMARDNIELKSNLDELQGRYASRKNALIEKQRQELGLSKEERKLLHRLSKQQQSNELIERLQDKQDKGKLLFLINKIGIKYLESKQASILESEIDSLKKLAQDKPTKVQSYQDALRTKNISVTTFKERIEGLSMQHQAEIDDVLDDWLNKKGFLTISEDENGLESKKLTMLGLEVLLRHLGVFVENPNLKELRNQKNVYWGKMSIEQVTELLRTAQPQAWVLTESPEIRGQLIISQKSSQSEIAHINIPLDWDLDFIKQRYGIPNLLSPYLLYPCSS